MRKISQFVISIVLVLFFLVSTGSVFAYACSCAEEMVQKHNCCTEQPEQDPCFHPNHETGIGIKKVEQTQNCFCSITPKQTVIGNSEFGPVIGKYLAFGELLAHNPVISSMTQSQQKPIWLRRLFYPDKSKVYLDSQHLLL